MMPSKSTRKRAQVLHERFYQGLLLTLLLSIAAWGVRMNSARLLVDLSGTWKPCARGDAAAPSKVSLVPMTEDKNERRALLCSEFVTPNPCLSHGCKLIFGNLGDAATVTVNGLSLHGPPFLNIEPIAEKRQPLGLYLPPSLLREEGAANQVQVDMRLFERQYSGRMDGLLGIATFEEASEYLRWRAFNDAFLPLAVSVLTAIVIFAVTCLPAGGMGLPHRYSLFRYAAANALFMGSFTRFSQLIVPISLALPLHFLLRFFADYALFELVCSALYVRTRLQYFAVTSYRVALSILAIAGTAGIGAAQLGVQTIQIDATRYFLLLFYPWISTVMLVIAARVAWSSQWIASIGLLLFAAVGFHDWALGHGYISGIFFTKYIHLLAAAFCLVALVRRAALAQAHETAARKAESDLAQLARQVDHDIRSPLAALNMATDQLDDSPESVQVIVRLAVGRIRDIADSLRASHRKPEIAQSAQKHKEASPTLLASMVEAVVSEKRMQFSKNLELCFDLCLTDASYSHFVLAPSSSLKRVLSNLLNNAAEAMKHRGRVCIAVTGDRKVTSVVITDCGPGMSEAALARLGEKGATFGKPGGSGLGIHHAMESIRALHGEIGFAKPEAGGTEVTVTLPRVTAPQWFADELAIRPQQKVLVLDDDRTIHAAWKRRLHAMDARLTHVSSEKELERWMLSADIKNAIFLIDHELGRGQLTGLEIIEKLKLQDRSFLVTSHFETEEVLAHCVKYSVRMIPKSMINIVPVHKAQ